MLTFKNYLTLSESTKDVYSAIGKSKGDSLLGTKVDPEVQKLHDKTFGAGVHHIEIPLANPVPDKVLEHIKSQGDSMEGNQVKLKSGRHVELSKYLPKSKASKSVLDDHENWSRNKGTSNSKLVISRHPGEVASASTGTHWDSCANLKGNGPAARTLHKEIKHGTLIAQHVHAEAKPDEHGEYAAKDILGRALIKRHDSPEGNISYHREGRSYGAFPHVAKEAMDHFTDHHYQQKDGVSTKHKDVYDDDESTVKINKSATSEFLHKAIEHKTQAVATAAIKHPNITADHIDKALLNKSSSVRTMAIQHPNATAAHIDKAMTDKSEDVRNAAIEHPNATSAHIDRALGDEDGLIRSKAIQHLKATVAHIDRAFNDKNEYVRAHAAAHPHATSAHIDKALSDKSSIVRAGAIKNPHVTSDQIDNALSDKDKDVRETAIEHPNATSDHIDKALTDKSEGVRQAAINHPKVTTAHIDRALTDKSEYIRRDAVEHRKVTPAHIDKALSDKSSMIRYTAMLHPNASAANIDRALLDKNSDVRHAAVYHPNATAAHIKQALADKDEDVRGAAIKKQQLSKK